MLMSPEFLKKYTNQITNEDFLTARELSIHCSDIRDNDSWEWLSLLDELQYCQQLTTLEFTASYEKCVINNIEELISVLPLLLPQLQQLHIRLVLKKTSSTVSPTFWRTLLTLLHEYPHAQFYLTCEVADIVSDLSMVTELLNTMNSRIKGFQIKWESRYSDVLSDQRHWHLFSEALSTCHGLTSLIWSCGGDKDTYTRNTDMALAMQALADSLHQIGSKLESLELILHLDDPENERLIDAAFKKINTGAQHLKQLKKLRLHFFLTSRENMPFDFMETAIEILLQLPKPEQLSILDLALDNASDALYPNTGYHPITAVHFNFETFIQRYRGLSVFILECTSLPGYLEEKLSVFIEHHPKLDTVHLKWRGSCADLTVASHILSNPRLRELLFLTDINRLGEPEFQQNPDDSHYQRQRAVFEERLVLFQQKIQKNTSLEKLSLRLHVEEPNPKKPVKILKLLKTLSENKTIKQLEVNFAPVKAMNKPFNVLMSDCWPNQLRKYFEKNSSLTHLWIGGLNETIYLDIKQLLENNDLRHREVYLPSFETEHYSQKLKEPGMMEPYTLRSWKKDNVILKMDSILFFHLAREFHHLAYGRPTQDSKKLQMLINFLSCILGKLNFQEDAVVKSEREIPIKAKLHIATYLNYKDLYKVCSRTGGLFFQAHQQMVSLNTQSSGTKIKRSEFDDSDNKTAKKLCLN